MKEKLTEYILGELKDAEKYCDSYEDVLRACHRALGAVMFAQFCGEVTYQEIQNDINWDNDIRDRFYKLANQKRRNSQ